MSILRHFLKNGSRNRDENSNFPPVLKKKMLQQKKLFSSHPPGVYMQEKVKLNWVGAGEGFKIKAKVQIAAFKGLGSILRMIGFGGMIVFMAPALSSIWDHESAAFPASMPIPQKQGLDLQNRLIQTEVQKYLGTPYRRGGGTRKGMDCSGFVRRIYQELFGVDLPYQARYQYHLGIFEKVSPQNLKTGDLIFFSATKNKKRINHVGIYLYDGQFAHAIRKSGVTISSLSNPHWKSRFFDAKRLPMEDGPRQELLEKYADGLAQIADQKSSITIGFAAGEFYRYRPATDLLTFWEARQESVFAPELTYTKALLGQSWTLNLAAFREFYVLDRPEDPFRKNRMDQETEVLSETFDLMHRDGFRLSSDLRLSDYLQITPSLTYFSAGRYIDTIYQPRLSFGIDLGIGSWYYDWPISMALNYSDLQPSASRLALPGDEREVFDMSITFRHRINPNLHLLFTGEYAERYQMVQQEPEKPFNEKKIEEQGFSIKLNITF